MANLWRRFSQDIFTGLFRAARAGLTKLGEIWEYLFTESPRPRHKRTWVRELVFFLLVRSTFITHEHRFMWLYSLCCYHMIQSMVYAYIGEQGTAAGGSGSRDADAGNTGNISNLITMSERFTKYVNVAVKLLFIFTSTLYQLLFISFSYTLVTVCYYLLAEGHVERILTKALLRLELEALEGLEKPYMQMLAGFVEILFSSFFMIQCLLAGRQLMMLLGLYSNIYTVGKDVINTAASTVFSEWTVLSNFERASKEELRNFDDVCAICLSTLRNARKTPCNHFFHGYCLRQCLKEKPSCPMCSTVFDLFKTD